MEGSTFQWEGGRVKHCVALWCVMCLSFLLCVCVSRHNTPTFVLVQLCELLRAQGMVYEYGSGLILSFYLRQVFLFLHNCFFPFKPPPSPSLWNMPGVPEWLSVVLILSRLSMGKRTFQFSALFVIVVKPQDSEFSFLVCLTAALYCCWSML